MESVENLRAAIARVFRAWEAYPSEISKFRIEGIMDTTWARYPPPHVDFAKPLLSYYANIDSTVISFADDPSS